MSTERLNTKIFSGIYWKISAIFLVIILLLSFIYLYISAFTAEMYYQEASQKLNAEVAAHIAEENRCFVNGTANKEVLDRVFHDVMIINPSLEVYLLDTDGRILTYFAPGKNVILDSVPLDPVREFISSDGTGFVMGADPKKEHGEKTFSAAEVYEDSVLRGYMYVILGGEEYESAAQFVFGSYMLRLGLRSMTITLIAAILIGLIAVGYITRNMRKIIPAIRSFRDGNLNARIDLTDKSEFREIADSFNEMADKIVSNMEEMKTMDNLRRELVANVSHDLRTPLSTIQGYIETILLKSETLTESDKDRYLHTILSSTDRLKNLVDELFELSKLEAREKVPVPEPFSIAELIQDMHQKNMILAKEKNIDLVVDFPFDLPMVYADIGMMEKVIQNLLDNALKFTGETGRVNIRLIPEKDFVRVNIEDTGQGISRDDLPNIFNRFRRSGKSSDDKNQGLGLGLAIVKKILEVHGIEINVESTEGKGTIFTFQIPVYKEFNLTGKKQLQKI